MTTVDLQVVGLNQRFARAVHWQPAKLRGKPGERTQQPKKCPPPFVEANLKGGKAQETGIKAEQDAQTILARNWDDHDEACRAVKCSRILQCRPPFLFFEQKVKMLGFQKRCEPLAFMLAVAANWLPMTSIDLSSTEAMSPGIATKPAGRACRTLAVADRSLGVSRIDARRSGSLFFDLFVSHSPRYRWDMTSLD